ALPGVEAPDDLGQLGMLAAGLAKRVEIARSILARKHQVDFSEAPLEVLELRLHRRLHVATDQCGSGSSTIGESSARPARSDGASRCGGTTRSGNNCSISGSNCSRCALSPCRRPVGPCRNLLVNACA